MGDPASDRIAIVGMGGVFPGAPTLDRLWRNVCDGVDAVTDVPPGRWDPVFHDPAATPGRVDRFSCRRGGFVDDVAHFDPAAFGIMPVVVDGGEPDQFLALAQAAAALDDAGEAHARVAPDRIGVIVGRGGYRTPGVARLDQRVHTVQQLVEGLRALLPDLDAERLDQVRDEFVRRLGPDRPEASIGLVPNLAASRIANRLDFQGPAYTVDAACASTLVAVDHGRHELARGRCDLVVVGGTHHCHDVTLWSVFSQLEALSPSGEIRPFSRRADGLLIGEGTGFFVLKRLGDAERDSDRIYAVVRGSGVASDGRSTSLMSPNPSGQIMAIEQAWQAADLDPTTVGLIEAHGTGTPAGDQAELETLRKVFGSAGPGVPRAGLGSIKSMIGHAMPAAGAAGLAKAALALHHRVLPPTLHAGEPHPLVDETRFRLVTGAEPWEAPGGAPRRAGVNAFGFGGINAHLVLEEHPSGATSPAPLGTDDPAVPPAPHRRGRASTATSNVAASHRRAASTTERPDGSGRLAGPDATTAAPATDSSPATTTSAAGARTAAGAGGSGPGRSPLPATLLLAGADAADLGRRLDEWVAAHGAVAGGEHPAAPAITDVPERPGPARLAIVGVDSRRLELARKVVARGQPWRGRNGLWFEPHGLLLGGGKVAFLFPGVEPTFAPRVDDVAEHFGLDALAATLADARRTSRPPLERQSRGILAVGRLLDAALGRLGIRPDMVAGHSLGEWSGELATGVVPGERFAELLEKLQPGAIKVADVVFVALGCGAGTAAELVAGLGRTVVSHDNCTHQSVVCGPPGEISELTERCRARRILAQELPFRSGFHSPLFAAHVPALRAALGDLPLHAPRIPLWSATTCRPYPADVEGVRDLVLRHLVEPVRFRELTLALHAAGARVFVQVGVGNLTGFVDDTLRDHDAVTVAANTTKRTGLEQLCHVAAALWVQGRAVASGPLASPPGEAPRAGRVSAAIDTDSATATYRARDAGRNLYRPRPARASRLDLGTRLVRDLTPLELPPEPPAVRNTASRQQDPPPTATDANARAPESLVVTRGLSLEEVPAWADHAFFRQRDGWPHTDDRFPLVPMTGIVEMLQEHANRLRPELVPVAVADVAAFRWLTVDPPVEVTLRATIVPPAEDDPAGSVRVKAAVDGHARATVVLAPRYPAPTPANNPRLANERPSHLDAGRFYIDRHMFHGPAYQGIRTFQAVGDNGSRAVLKSLAAPGALLDNAGQLMGHWLSAHAEVDRLVLPTSIERVDLFGPHPPPGTLVDCTVTVTRLDERVLRADMLLTVDRRLWCRVTGWEDRRFATDALVFETLQWPEKAGVSVERGPYTLVDERWPDSPTRDVVMRRYLGNPEREQYERHHPLGQRAFLLGHIAVKDAVRRWLWGRRRGPLFPAEIVVANEAGGRPLARGPFTDDLRVALAHVEGRAVAIVADGVDVGIDIERVEPRRPSFESLVLSAAEQQLTPPEGYDRDTWLTTLWAVKEAAARATGTGLRGRPREVEIAERDGTTARVGDRWIAFERLPGAAPTSPSSAAQKEHIVAWTVTDR